MLTLWTIVDCTVNLDKPADGPTGHQRRCEFLTTDIQNNYLQCTGTNVHALVPVCVHWCPTARADSQSPATTMFDPIAAVRI